MQLVPKPNSKNMYCNACKDKYEDYLEVSSILFSTFSQINIKRKFKIIFLMTIFLSCKINTRLTDQRSSSKKNKSHSPPRPPMWLWLMSLRKFNSYLGQPRRWNTKKIANKKILINKTRTLLMKGIKILRNITSFMISCSIGSGIHTGTYCNWILKIFTTATVYPTHTSSIPVYWTSILCRIIWSCIHSHMLCNTMLIIT